MSTLLAALVLSTAVQAPRQVLDHRLLPDFGEVTLSGGGHQLRVEIRTEDSTRSQDFELDELPGTARIRAGRINAFVRGGLVAAFSIEDGEKTSYHLLLSMDAQPAANTVRISDLAASAEGIPSAWRMTRAIFVSTGEPYRIVEVNDTGGDGLEITFRRGWPKLERPDLLRIDEKVLYSNCGLAYLAPLPRDWLEPSESPWGTLIEVDTVRRADGQPR